MMRTILLTLGGVLFANMGFADALSDSAQRQRALTSKKVLSNGAIFVQREIPRSDIVHLEINFPAGQANVPEATRALPAFAFDVMPMGTKKYKKEQIFALTERLSINLQCAGGIEQSGCQIETVSENLDQAIQLLASVIKEPTFAESDVDVARQRRVAQYQSESQNPEQHVNSMVNTIFYQVGHPYRHLPQDGVKQIAGFKAADLRAYHHSILNGQDMQIIYAGPALPVKAVASIEKAFGAIAKKPRTITPIPAPQYQEKSVYVFEHRPIPTAYIRAKFNAPGATSKDAAVARVLFEIMGEELHEEVRTKRSLSYAIGAMTLQLEQGIGVVSASTSKPRETIETISQVLRKIKETPYTESKLAEYKNVFTTSYYLTLEAHDNLAGALSLAQFHLGDAAALYELPAKIAAVTPADVQRLARDTLKQMRIGIVYDKEKFMPEWTDPITKLQ